MNRGPVVFKSRLHYFHLYFEISLQLKFNADQENFLGEYHNLSFPYETVPLNLYKCYFGDLIVQKDNNTSN